MSSHFSRYEFWGILEDIETYLGYLKGNELIYEYVHRASQQVGTDGDWQLRPFTYTGKCPDERFKLHHTVMIVGPVEADPMAWSTQTKQAFDDSWDNGVAWAAGLKDYCRSVTDQITLPELATLRSGISTMQTEVVSRLNETTLDDWAHLGGNETPWTGLAADSFQELYLNYNELLELYGFYQGYAAMSFGMAGAAVAHYQAALIPFVTDLRDHLESQLSEWVFGMHGPPATLPTWMVTTGEIAGDVFDVVGGVNKTVDAIGDIIGRIETLIGIIDAVSPKGKERDFPFASAEDIYTNLTDTFYRDYYEGFRTLLDDLATGKGTEEMELGGDLAEETFSSADIAGRLDDKPGREWFMPEIPGSGDLNDDPQRFGSVY